MVFHHNVLAGGLSRRMGLARWRSAHKRLLATGADVILSGHDHQEGAGQIQGALAVSTSGTHSSRVRGGRPSVFNLVKIDPQAVHIQHFRWVSGEPAVHSLGHVLVCPERPAPGGGVGCGRGSGAVMEGGSGEAGSGEGGSCCSRDSLWPSARPAGHRASRHPYQPDGDAQPQRRVLRIHRGYAFAPDRVLQAIVRFLNPPGSAGAAPAGRARVPGVSGGGARAVHGREPSARERARPGDVVLLHRLESLHRRAQRGTLRRRAGRDPDPALGPDAHPAGRARGRDPVRPPDSISPSAGVTSPGTRGAEVEHTLLHEMVHQWQAETGLRIDHGPTFRKKAREVGVLPAATRAISKDERRVHVGRPRPDLLVKPALLRPGLAERLRQADVALPPRTRYLPPGQPLEAGI